MSDENLSSVLVAEVDETVRARVAGILPTADYRTEMCRSAEANALAKLETQDWPRNVREFANVIERSLALTSEAGLDAKAIRAVDGLSVVELDSGESEPGEHRPCENTAIDGIPLEELEAIYIEEVLELTRGNKLMAARILGTVRATPDRCKP